MEAPHRTYRFRPSPRQRFERDLHAALFFSALLFALPYLVLPTRLVALFVGLWITARLVERAWKYRQREREAIHLYSDRVTWKDERGEDHEARFSDVFDVVAGPRRNLSELRSRTGTLTITPVYEGFTDLRRRLDPDWRGLPLGESMEDRWLARESYRHSGQEVILGSAGIGIGMYLSITSAVRSASLYGSPAWISPVLMLVLALYILPAAYFTRIEVRDGDLRWYDWTSRLRKSVRLTSLLGASIHSEGFSRTGIIDTDRGPIHFSMRLEGAEELVHEVERLCALRLAKERGLLASQTPAETVTERVSRA